MHLYKYVRRLNLTGVVLLEEINGRVDTNGDKEEETKVWDDYAWTQKEMKRKT